VGTASRRPDIDGGDQIETAHHGEEGRYSSLIEGGRDRGQTVGTKGDAASDQPFGPPPELRRGLETAVGPAGHHGMVGDEAPDDEPIIGVHACTVLPWPQRWVGGSWESPEQGLRSIPDVDGAGLLHGCMADQEDKPRHSDRSELGFFDRFAGGASRIASRAPFFVFCLMLVGIWLIQGVVTIIANRDFSSFTDATYQLEINTTTTIVTFLMVALLQNSQTRSEMAVHQKLNAIADGLADLMESLSQDAGKNRLTQDVEDLRNAVGLEDRASTGRK
jgi:hypothetical protein